MEIEDGMAILEIAMCVFSLIIDSFNSDPPM